jgi:hypothetical protein
VSQGEAWAKSGRKLVDFARFPEVGSFAVAVLGQAVFFCGELRLLQSFRLGEAIAS